MGDRGHIHLITSEKPDDPGIWVYTHHYGTELLETTGRGLVASKSRWHDPGYGAAAFISSIMNTVSGIATTPDDMGDGGRVVHVDFTKQEVTIEAMGNKLPVVTFEFYCETPLSETWATARSAIGWRG